MAPKRWLVGGVALTVLVVACGGENFDALFADGGAGPAACLYSTGCGGTCSGGSSACVCGDSPGNCSTCGSGTICRVACNRTTGCSMTCPAGLLCRLDCPSVALLQQGCVLTCADGSAATRCGDRGFACNVPLGTCDT